MKEPQKNLTEEISLKMICRIKLTFWKNKWVNLKIKNKLFRLNMKSK
jgi:hypothetical protein